MKKRVKGKKLSRSTTARKALFRSQIKALAEYGKIETTYTKAKVLKRQTDKLMSGLTKESQPGFRKTLALLANDKTTVNLLIKQKKTTKRISGFTRVIPLPPRRGDNVKRGRVEWVDRAEIDSKNTNKSKGQQKNQETKGKLDNKSKKATNTK